MKFLLFNVMAVAALTYLFVRGEGMPSLPETRAMAVAAVPGPPSQPSPQAPPELAVQPVVETEIDVVPPVVHAVPEGRVEGPPAPSTRAPASLRDRRRDLARLVRDMDRFAAERLSR